MLKDKKGHRSHKRTKHSGMGGCGTPTSSENTSPCILIKKGKTKIQNGKNKTFNLENEKLKVLNNGVKVGEKWPEIYEYFSRCLVKSSAESRASGAGAGLVDTD